jgi:hypothetical protein
MNQVIIPIHFGNPEGKHEISADSLIIFIQSYKKIALCFGLKLDIEIGVPEEGSWKTTIITTVISLALLPIGETLLSNFVAPFFTGMTLDELSKKLENSGKKQYAEIIMPLTSAINEFITTPSKNIPDNIPIECLESKNAIFEQFKNDDCIIDFTLADLAIILKNSFPNYIAEIPKETPTIKYFGEKEIQVSRLDWSGKNNWFGQITSNKTDLSFKFDKKLTKAFWTKIKKNQLDDLTTVDIMKAQLIQKIISDGKPEYEVIRVLKYSNNEIDSALSHEEIEKIIQNKLAKIKNSKSTKTNHSDDKQFTFEGF